MDGLPSLAPAISELLEDWRSMALKASNRHSDACDHFESLDARYGVVSTALTAVAGSALFVTLKASSTAFRIIAGVIGIVAAIASGIQTPPNTVSAPNDIGRRAAATPQSRGTSTNCWQVHRSLATSRPSWTAYVRASMTRAR